MWFISPTDLVAELASPSRKGFVAERGASRVGRRAVRHGIVGQAGLIGVTPAIDGLPDAPREYWVEQVFWSTDLSRSRKPSASRSTSIVGMLGQSPGLTRMRPGQGTSGTTDEPVAAR